jgi:PII-like signaling protein
MFGVGGVLMGNLKILKTEADDRSEATIAMLEALIERIRDEGVSQISVFYCPMGSGGTFADFFSTDIVGLVGALEVQKHNALAYREGGE